MSNCPPVAGQCDFGSNCRFSHMSERDLQELSLQVEGASPGPWAGGQGVLGGVAALRLPHPLFCDCHVRWPVASEAAFCSPWGMSGEGARSSRPCPRLGLK